MLVIGWDRTMKTPNDYKAIKPSRVAVKNGNTTEPNPYSLNNPDYRDSSQDHARRLNVRYYKLLNVEEAIDPEWYAIIESLEIKLKPGPFSEERYLNLTWEMKSYDSELIFIQLYFDYPDKVSEETYFDTL
jgi:hypothetical protein